MTIAQKDERMLRLQTSENLADVNDAQLVIEAVVEDMDVKRALFSELDRRLPPEAILATNTSYLDINEITAATGRPEKVLGLHFFSPAHVMRLVEVVVADKTDADTVATGVMLAKRMGKVPVRAGVADGFIGNRVLSAYRLAADFLLEDGATPYQIDTAMKEWGMPLGPYEVLDLAGLDISWARRKRLSVTRDPAHRYVAIGDRLCEMGRLGQKTGCGYYIYEDGAKGGQEDPDVLDLIDLERERKGIVARDITKTEIQRRCLAAMVNEGMRLLDEKIAARPSDIDTVMINGFGFPRWRGGPMKAADLCGLFSIQQDLRRWAGEAPEFWTPHPMLGALIKNGQTFDALN